VRRQTSGGRPEIDHGWQSPVLRDRAAIVLSQQQPKPLLREYKNKGQLAFALEIRQFPKGYLSPFW